ncbi:hypothetical protein J8273_2502 [Carpediemonas membranifera]|uniref:Uncharacterized protein n=1 Tax=Carpediemonas membranifera TaxID=201153 RepID=A0A8J6B122_9EUKA|nr:hypothetical protein J8273_2502 [Carpediemonas membranifera]|eukprot:KAG9396150.1 hypothetical protein J8273_2502 [Carpediemonas membranifera]
MDAPISVPVDVKAALIAAYQLSTAATARIPGDIPSLLAHAYSRHFHENMHSIRNAGSHSPPADTTMLESLIAMLSEIPPLAPTAQVLLDRARSILADGPPLSMNIELAEGEELPVALHTLLQGTLWALLVESGADPDLEGTQPAETAYSQADKLPWFLCRKLLLTCTVAAKDGVTAPSPSLSHRLYAGRVFEATKLPRHIKLTRVRVPPVVSLHCDRTSVVAQTVKGLWGWGDPMQLGCMMPGERGLVSQPGRLRFAGCPELEDYEERLPTWEKHALVSDMSMVGQGFDGDSRFCPVALPDAFAPDRIMTRRVHCDSKQRLPSNDWRCRTTAANSASGTAAQSTVSSTCPSGWRRSSLHPTYSASSSVAAVFCSLARSLGPLSEAVSSPGSNHLMTASHPPRSSFPSMMASKASTAMSSAAHGWPRRRPLVRRAG